MRKGWGSLFILLLVFSMSFFGLINVTLAASQDVAPALYKYSYQIGVQGSGNDVTVSWNRYQITDSANIRVNAFETYRVDYMYSSSTVNDSSMAKSDFATKICKDNGKWQPTTTQSASSTGASNRETVRLAGALTSGGLVAQPTYFRVVVTELSSEASQAVKPPFAIVCSTTAITPLKDVDGKITIRLTAKDKKTGSALDAKVSVDGKVISEYPPSDPVYSSKSTTPLTLRTASDGSSHTIKFEKDGYETHAHTLIFFTSRDYEAELAPVGSGLESSGNDKIDSGGSGGVEPPKEGTSTSATDCWQHIRDILHPRVDKFVACQLYNTVVYLYDNIFKLVENVPM